MDVVGFGIRFEVEWNRRRVSSIGTETTRVSMFDWISFFNCFITLSSCIREIPMTSLRCLAHSLVSKQLSAGSQQKIEGEPEKPHLGLDIPSLNCGLI